MHEKFKSVLFIKCKLILLTLGILLSIFFIFNFINANNEKQIFMPADFKSNIVDSDEKYINNEGLETLFTYGPYVNLKKGNYKVIINYDSDFDNGFDIGINKSAEILERGTLMAESNKKEIQLNIENNQNDYGFEIRTYYKGQGFFNLESVEIESLNFALNEFIFMIAFIVMLVLVFILFNKNMYSLYFAFIYYSINMFLIYNVLCKDIKYMVFGIGASIVLIFTGYILQNNISGIIKNIKVEEIICLALASYISAAIASMFLNETSADTIDFVINIDIYIMLGLTALFFNVFVLLRILFDYDYLIYRILCLSVLLYGLMIIIECENNIYFASGVIAVTGFFIYFLCSKDRMKIVNFEMSSLTAIIILCVLFSVVSGVVAWNTVCRYRIFSSSSFDFGIFAQMYENMAKTGMPVTTCERNELLSHFYVHFSPIYYTILPFYMIFRSPDTILVFQTLLVTSTVFPVFLICKKHNLSNFICLAVSITVLFLPGFISPLYYDFHENKFLAVLILWLIYFMESNKSVGAYIFTVLILMVKEDAGLYVIFLALYYIAARQKYKKGLIILGIAVVYFAAVLMFIQSGGESLMNARYGSYYIPGQDGMGLLVKNILSNPTLFVKNNFTEDTFVFIVYMFAPFLFVPFASSDFKKFILLVPMVVMNLMTPYSYQHDIGFQYTYGSASLIILLFIINIKDLKLTAKYTICITAVFASVFLTYTKKGDLLFDYSRRYTENRDNYDRYAQTLKSLPEDVSITADSFIIPHLYYVDRLYYYDENNFINSDYVVIFVDNEIKYQEQIINSGYEEEYRDDKFIFYKNPSAPKIQA